MDNLQLDDAVQHIEHIFRYTFQNKLLLAQALTHRSCGTKEPHYERLEFIGDAVLGLIVGNLLFSHYTSTPEGMLSKMRASLVSAHSLSELSRSLGLGSYIRMSTSELSSGGREKNSILADVFESIIGAIYLDSHFETVFDIVSTLIAPRIKEISVSDAKTELQELLHSQGKEPPLYEVESLTGPDHAPTFVTVVKIDGRIVGRGTGNSKKISQQLAAQEALQILKPQ